MQMSLDKIGRNDPCPCKSGNKYKKCCMGKFDFIGSNFEGETIKVNKEINQKDYENLMEFGRNKLLTDPDTARDTTIDEGVEFVKEAYELFDKAISIFDQYIPCKKGCNTCCKLIVETSPIEAEYLRRYILSNFNEQEISQLEEKCKLNARQSPNYRQLLNTPDYMKKYFQMQIACPFLSESGVCIVYTARPQACRRHIVFSEPATCGYDKKQNLYKGGITRAIEDIVIQMSVNIYKNQFVLTKYTSATEETVFMVKHLSQWFANGFKEIDLSKHNSL